MTLTASELAKFREEWLTLQQRIVEAIDRKDLTAAVRLSEDCRRLDRVIFSQPYRIGAGK